MMSIGKIESGLTHWTALVRINAAIGDDYTPTDAQIEQGLNHKKWGVRLAFARRMDIVLTPEQIDRGLNSRYQEMRRAFMLRMDFLPTKAQIERGLETADHAEDPEFENNFWQDAIARSTISALISDASYAIKTIKTRRDL
jgi:hypothetical protein